MGPRGKPHSASEWASPGPGRAAKIEAPRYLEGGAKARAALLDLLLFVARQPREAPRTLPVSKHERAITGVEKTGTGPSEARARHFAPSVHSLVVPHMIRLRKIDALATSNAPLRSFEALELDGPCHSATAREQVQENTFPRGGGGQSTALAPRAYSATRSSQALNQRC